VEIQSKVASGEIVHVTATRALELGIDIGDLSCCIMLGYPGSVASTLQEAGRVGRTGDSLVVLMLRADHYEQYFARLPGAFFELLKTSETPKLPIENEYLLSRHVMCANWKAVNFKAGYTEANFVKFFPAKIKQVLEQLENEDKITGLRDKGQMYWRYKKGSPARNDIYQSIRVPISVGKFNVMERGANRFIGECDSYLVPRDLFPEAVWLNNGQAFRSVQVKYGEKLVYVDRLTDDDPDIETFALPQHTITHKDSPKTKEHDGCAVGSGDVNVIRQVKLYREVGFARGSEDQGEIKTTHTRDIEYDTTACWFDFDPDLLLSNANWRSKKANFDNVIAGVHGFEHVIRSVAPHVAGCDRHDISSSIEFAEPPKRLIHRVYLLDTFAGGIGFAEFCYTHVSQVLEWAQRSLVECKCKDGCPQCLIVPWCSLRDQPISKKDTLTMVRYFAEQIK
jgi:DEAD/DEAH box helicase domain-containing protein